MSEKKAGVKMPKSVKRMLALMGEENRKVYKPIMYSAVQTEYYEHLKMLRRKSGDKEDSGE